MSYIVRFALVLVSIVLLQAAQISTAILGAIIFLAAIFAPPLIALFSGSQSVRHQGTVAFASADDAGRAGIRPPRPRNSEGLSYPNSRKYFFYLISGGVGVFIFWLLVAARWVFLDGQTLSIVELASIEGLGNFLLLIVTLGMLFSVALGFFLYYFYYGFYYFSGLRIRFSEIDRATKALKNIDATYRAELKSIGWDPRWIKNTKVRLERKQWLLVFGPDVYLLPKKNRDEYLLRVRNNWELLDRIYQKLVSLNSKNSNEAEAKGREDVYVLLGVSRTSLFIGVVVYFGYEIIRLRNSVIPSEYFLMFLLTILVTLAIFWCLNFARLFLGKESVNYKSQFIKNELDKVRYH